MNPDRHADKHHDEYYEADEPVSHSKHAQSPGWAEMSDVRTTLSSLYLQVLLENLLVDILHRWRRQLIMLRYLILRWHFYFWFVP
jgi:hypothetical protein